MIWVQSVFNFHWAITATQDDSPKVDFNNFSRRICGSRCSTRYYWMWSIYEIIHIWTAFVDEGAMLYQLSYEATRWERGQFIEFI